MQASDLPTIVSLHAYNKATIALPFEDFLAETHNGHGFLAAIRKHLRSKDSTNSFNLAPSKPIEWIDYQSVSNSRKSFRQYYIKDTFSPYMKISPLDTAILLQQAQSSSNSNSS